MPLEEMVTMKLLQGLDSPEATVENPRRRGVVLSHVEEPAGRRTNLHMHPESRLCRSRDSHA